jgi:hypothetical protein
MGSSSFTTFYETTAQRLLTTTLCVEPKVDFGSPMKSASARWPLNWLLAGHFHDIAAQASGTNRSDRATLELSILSAPPPYDRMG